nr:transposase [Orientia tsutsugamushi]
MESVGCKVIFLLPYSPDLNPIEKFWANMKT